MARQTRSATHQRRSNTRRSSPRASPSPVPSSSSLSPRKRSRTHEDDYDDSLEERETVGKVPTAARKTRRTTAAAVTPASVLTSSDKTSTSIPRLIRSLPRRAGKVLDAEQKEADGSARSARLSSARRQANVDELASTTASASSSRAPSSRKRFAITDSEDVPATTTTPKSAKKTRKAREVEFDDDEPVVLPAGPSGAKSFDGSSKLSADARRKVKGKGKAVVDEKDAELVELKQKLEEKEKLAEKQSQALAAIRSSVSCSLCDEIFHNPHTLACGHIFCRNCLEIAWSAERASNADDESRSVSATDSDGDVSGDESDAQSDVSETVYSSRRPRIIGFRPLGAGLSDYASDESEDEDDYDTAPYSSGALYGLTVGKRRVVEVDGLRDEDAATAFARASEAMLNDFAAYVAKKHERGRDSSPTPSTSTTGGKIEEIDEEEAAEIEQSKAGPSRVRNGRRETVPARAGLALALTRRRQEPASRRSPSATAASSRSSSPGPPAQFSTPPAGDSRLAEICCPTCGQSCADTPPMRVYSLDGILDTMGTVGVSSSGAVGGAELKGKKIEKETPAEEEDETWEGLFSAEKEDQVVEVIKKDEMVEHTEKEELATEEAARSDGRVLSFPFLHFERSRLTFSIGLPRSGGAQNLLTAEMKSSITTGDALAASKGGDGETPSFASIQDNAASSPAVPYSIENAGHASPNAATSLVAKLTPPSLTPPRFFGITAFRSSTSGSSATSSSGPTFATSPAAFGLSSRSRSRSTSLSSALSSSSEGSTKASSVVEGREKKDQGATAPHATSAAVSTSATPERKNKADGLRLETGVQTRSASPSLRNARPQQGRKPGLGSDSTGLVLSSSSMTGDADVDTSARIATCGRSRKRARSEHAGEAHAAKEAVSQGKKARRG